MSRISAVKSACACMALGVTLVVSSVGLLTFNIREDLRAGEAAKAVAELLSDAVSADGGFESFYRTDGAGGSANVSYDDLTGAVDIDGYEYIGILDIPALELELPVMSQWSYEGLKTAPGRYSGSAQTDDLIICGHNYTRHFGNLKYLRQGDEIYFTDTDGETYLYEVRETVIIDSDGAEEMTDGADEWDLTLFTCTVGGQARVAVRCENMSEM